MARAPGRRAIRMRSLPWRSSPSNSVERLRLGVRRSKRSRCLRRATCVARWTGGLSHRCPFKEAGASVRPTPPSTSGPTLRRHRTNLVPALAPGINAAIQVSRIYTQRAQRRRQPLADLVAVCAVDDSGSIFRHGVLPIQPCARIEPPAARNLVTVFLAFGAASHVEQREVETAALPQGQLGNGQRAHHTPLFIEWVAASATRCRS